MNQFFLLLRRPALWIMAVLVLGSMLIKCKRCPDCKPPVIDEKLYPIPWNEATIQLSQNLSDEAIRDAFLQAGQKANDPTLTSDKIKIRRCPCDSLLTNVTLAGNYTIVGSGDPATVQSGHSGQSGDLDLPDGSVVAINYKLDTFDGPSPNEKDGNPLSSRTEQYQKLPDIGAGSTKTVAIGIFDSGLQDSYLSGLSWQYEAQTCLSPGELGGAFQNGFSFVDEPVTPTYLDVNPYRHGSRVAYLIARQFVGSGVIPKLIPFKVLDKENRGDMFALLCALETARLNGVQVYNLSLGYYGEDHPLLRTYFQRILANPNQYIVVAVGNRTTADMAADRSMDTMYPRFYPAALAAEFGFDRVLAVTTVQLPSLPKVEASLRQNYSRSLAWGVRADTADRFKLDGQMGSIIGSSFAAPILAGRLARLVGEGDSRPTQTMRTLMMVGTDGTLGRQVRRNRYLPSRP